MRSWLKGVGVVLLAPPGLAGQELSADDRRVLLQHAVLLSFADGTQAPEEAAMVEKLASVVAVVA